MWTFGVSGYLNRVHYAVTSFCVVGKLLRQVLLWTSVLDYGATGYANSVMCAQGLNFIYLRKYECLLTCKLERMGLQPTIILHSCLWLIEKY